MVDAGWTTTEAAVLAWPDAKDIPTPRLTQLLIAAWESCVIYAPVLADGVEVPQRYKEAQVLHARAIWTAARAQTTGLGLDGEVSLATVTPTLSSQVMQLLRPPGPPVVG